MHPFQGADTSEKREVTRYSERQSESIASITGHLSVLLIYRAHGGRQRHFEFHDLTAEPLLAQHVAMEAPCLHYTESVLQDPSDAAMSVFRACKLCETVWCYNLRSHTWRIVHRNVGVLAMCRGPERSVLVKSPSKIIQLGWDNERTQLTVAEELQCLGSFTGMTYVEHQKTVVLTHLAIGTLATVHTVRLSDGYSLWQVRTGPSWCPIGIHCDPYGRLFVVDERHSQVVELSRRNGEILRLLQFIRGSLSFGDRAFWATALGFLGAFGLVTFRRALNHDGSLSLSDSFPLMNFRGLQDFSSFVILWVVACACLKNVDETTAYELGVGVVGMAAGSSGGMFGATLAGNTLGAITAFGMGRIVIEIVNSALGETSEMIPSAKTLSKVVLVGGRVISVLAKTFRPKTKVDERAGNWLGGIGGMVAGCFCGFLVGRVVARKTVQSCGELSSDICAVGHIAGALGGFMAGGWFGGGGGYGFCLMMRQIVEQVSTYSDRAHMATLENPRRLVVQKRCTLTLFPL